jgi:hypothetical protein
LKETENEKLLWQHGWTAKEKKKDLELLENILSLIQQEMGGYSILTER